MHYFIYPDKDATIYKRQNTQNTGLDEIIEVEKSYYAGSLREIARGLIKFDVSSISSSMSSGDIALDADFYLNLKITQAEEIPLSYTIYAFPVSQSWEMGVGTKFDGVTNTGTSWLYRDSADNASLWVEGSTLLTGSLNANTTGSSDGTGGGTWYINTVCSQSFDYEEADIRMDVSSIIREWISGSIPNEGFIIKHSDAVESDNQDYGSLKFYSRDTNTIFPPTLEVAWSDSTISITGSASEVTDEDRVVKVKGLRDEYKVNSRPKFRIYARSRYPEATFGTGNPYVQETYLPTSSYYSIIDAATEHVIVPFSDTTQLSIDSEGSYFKQWLDGFQPERAYRIAIKVEREGIIDYYDFDETFKVVR